MTHDDLQSWLDRYVEAWRSNDPADIGALFTDDVVYRYRPYGGDAHATTGRDAIVTAWLEEGDAPDSWEARYEPFAIEDDRAVATGFSRYLASSDEPQRTFHNVFLLRFGPDGQCAEFTELYMLEEE